MDLSALPALAPVIGGRGLGGLGGLHLIFFAHHPAALIVVLAIVVVVVLVKQNQRR